MTQPDNYANNQASKQTINESSWHPIKTNQPNDHPNKPSNDQSTKPFGNPTKQSNQTKKLSLIQTNQPINQPNKQSINQTWNTVNKQSNNKSFN